MSVVDIFRTALYSLGANRLRAALALLGIVLGVSSVIVLMAIGRGSTDRVTDLITGLGTNLLFVTASGYGEPLTMEDAAALSDPVFAPSIELVAPTIDTFGWLTAGNRNTTSSVSGVTPEFLDARNLEMASGVFISAPYVESRSEVIVLGSQISEELFGRQDPTGGFIRLNGRRFRVIGVLDSQGGGGFGSLDSEAFIPITTAYYRLSDQRTPSGAIEVSQISVAAASVDLIDQAIDEIEGVLRLSHRITDADDFLIINQQEILDTFEETNQTMVVFLGAVAGISLLVGGIGIMNIMLVSVTERTREIGVRQAMGAKRRDIVAQFVAESVFLTLGGGLMGVVCGIAIAFGIDDRDIIGNIWSTRVTNEIPVIALIVSVGIGLFFGIYPALRAARLNPIDALRHE